MSNKLKTVRIFPFLSWKQSFICNPVSMNLIGADIHHYSLKISACDLSGEIVTFLQPLKFCYVSSDVIRWFIFQKSVLSWRGSALFE